MILTLSNPDSSNSSSTSPSSTTAPQVKCSQAQRQFIDLKLRSALRMDYDKLLQLCRKEFLRDDIKDLVNLSMHEANILIHLLQHRIAKGTGRAK